MTAPSTRVVCQHTGTIARPCPELSALARERDVLDVENAALRVREQELEAEVRALRALVKEFNAEVSAANQRWMRSRELQRELQAAKQGRGW